MAEWTRCPSCQLNHVPRPDGRCPRCGKQVAGEGWGSGAPAPAAPQQADPWSAPPATQPPSPWDAPQAAAAVATGPYAAADAFTIGGFLSGSFATWGRNVGPVLLVTLLTWSPFAVAIHAVYSRMPAALAAQDPTELLKQVWGIAGAMMLLSPLCMGAVVRGGIRRLRGEPVSLGDMLAVGLRSYLRGLALFLLVFLATVLTSCTVVLPVILLTGWAASLPALIEEGLGPMAALQRSWELTRGLRWQVLAGFLVLFIAMAAVTCVGQVLIGVLVVLAAKAGGANVAEPGATMAVAQAVNVLLSGVVSSVYTTATAVAYHQVRVATEGPAGAQLAQVFE